MRPRPVPALLVLAGLAACSTAPSRQEQATELVAALRSGDAAARSEAVATAAMAPAASIPAIGALLAAADAEVVHAAERSLEGMAHEAAGPRAKGETTDEHVRRRLDVAHGLLELAAEGAAGGPLPAAERRAVLRILSVVADDRESARGVAALLDDPDLEEAALFALRRIPHPEADTLLLQRLGRPATPPGPAALARVLGDRRSVEAVPALLALATDSTDAETARAARHALARIGDARAMGPLLAAYHSRQPGAADDLLLLSDALLADRRIRETQPIWAALAVAPAPQLRCAALRGRVLTEGIGAAGVLLAALADPAPDVRGTARNLLAELPGGGLAEPLLVTLDEARPAVRAQILEVLARRRDPEAAVTLRRYLDDPAAEVRLAALAGAALVPDADLRASLQTVLAGAAREEAEREAAAEALLGQAHALHRAGNAEAAAAIYLCLLDAPESVSAAAMSGAMQGIAALGHPESVERLEALARAGRWQHEAEQALVTLGGRIATRDRATSERILTGLCVGSASRSVRQDAARILERMGVDTSAFAAQAGFLVHWRLDGPHPLPAKEDFASQPFGEGVPDDSGWKEAASQDLDGVVDLLRMFDKTENVCVFALARFTVDEDYEAVLRLGSDDGVVAWLDGERVHENDVYRGLSVDQDQVPVRLAAGEHTLLLKITQGGGDWQFCARFTDTAGRPVVVRQEP